MLKERTRKIACVGVLFVSVVSFVVLNVALSFSGEPEESPAPTLIAGRVLYSRIRTQRGSVFYLGKRYSAAKYKKIKKGEARVMKRDLQKLYKLKFKVRTTKYFNVAYRCSEAKMNHLLYYLVRFFRHKYATYFKYEPLSTFRIVYFRDQREFIRKTGSEAYGYYHPSVKTLYTYTNSGHGTLWHEMIHAFMDANVSRDVQQWFNEGFASFYEMAFLHRGMVVEGYSNWRMPALKRALRNGRMPHLKDFLLEQWMGVSFGYAQARFFFCYLWQKRRMVSFVHYYLYRLVPNYHGAELGRRTIVILELLLGKNIDKIQQEFVALIKRTGTNQKLRRL